MTSRFTTLVVALGLTCGIALHAADLSGKWTAKVPSRNEARDTTFTFKQDGAKLTGTLSAAGQDIQIQDGTVEGDTVSFSVTQAGGGGSAKVLFKGTVSGNQIKFTRQREGGDPREFTAMRAGS